MSPPHLLCSWIPLLMSQQGETTLIEKDELSTCNRRHRRSEASPTRSLPLPKQVHQIARNTEPCIHHWRSNHHFHFSLPIASFFSICWVSMERRFLDGACNGG
ncbi:hypothetical protein VIGAN_01509000 [Vigna angularis var. angularis]|uniref:Uncharacterized protein n=1 Tax=Vigna angularis var. angularis TaxID=157739 RepID=A0A0S3R8W0_PHAAN|nr:hypothetical protein VIGAN_01509000 [Vigna angularis var. angularis]